MKKINFELPLTPNQINIFIMKKTFYSFALASLFLGAVACGNNAEQSEVIDDAVENVEDTIDEAEDAIEDAADEAQDTAENAIEEAQDVVEEAAE